ncbi:MAG: response regulator [Chitinophagaceae bacterium]
MSMYFLLRNNKQTGPFTAQELIACKLQLYDLVWIEGKSAAWRYPEEIQDIKILLAAQKDQSVNSDRQVARETNNIGNRKQLEINSGYKPVAGQQYNEQEHNSLFVAARGGIKNPLSIEGIRKDLLTKNKPFPEDISAGNDYDTRESFIEDDVRGSGIRTDKERSEKNKTFSPMDKKQRVDRLIKVIIADDHAIFRAGVKAALAYKNDVTLIAEADNGRQLLNLLRHTEPDVILLDIQMPVMDGITALPEIRKIYPEVKVIILSMHDDHSMISKLMETGANSYLTKTAGSDAIYQAIKTCYEQEYYFNDTTQKALLDELRTIRSAEKEKISLRENVFADTVVREPQTSLIEKSGPPASPRKLHPFWMPAGIIALIAMGILTGYYFIKNSDSISKDTSGVAINSGNLNTQQSSGEPEGGNLDEINIEMDKPLPSPQTVTLPVEKPAGNSIAKQNTGKENIKSPVSSNSSIVTSKEVQATNGNNNDQNTDEAINQDKELNKINILSQISLQNNKYSKSAFGGVSGIELTLNNNSSYKLDMVEVEVDYLRGNDKILRTEKLVFRDIAPGATIMQQAPDNPRGVKVKYKIVSVRSNSPGVSFPGG